MMDVDLLNKERERIRKLRERRRKRRERMRKLFAQIMQILQLIIENQAKKKQYNDISNDEYNYNNLVQFCYRLLLYNEIYT